MHCVIPMGEVYDVVAPAALLRFATREVVISRGLRCGAFGPRVPGRSESAGPCVGECGSWFQRYCFLRIGRMQHERAVPSAADSPAAVVELEVMESAEQQPAIDVGAASVGSPMVDMVGFAVGGGAVAAVPTTAAVAHRESDALP